MEDHAAKDAILQNVHFTQETLLAHLHIDAAVGFLAVDTATTGLKTFIGFGGIPGTGALPPITNSVTELSALPSEERTVDRQGKGVGMRLYNTPHALSGLQDLPARTGAYAFSLNTAPNYLLDTRKTADSTPSGKIRRIVQHAGRIVFSRTEGLAVPTNAIHESYGDAHAVLIGQPPRARIRETARGVHPPIPSAFFIIRNPYIAISGVGECRSPLPRDYRI